MAVCQNKSLSATLFWTMYLVARSLRVYRSPTRSFVEMDALALQEVGRGFR